MECEREADYNKIVYILYDIGKSKTYLWDRQVDSYKVPTSELVKQSGLKRQKITERDKTPE